MKLNIKKLLDFFDDKGDYHKGDVNAVVAVLGEDLNVAIYKHYRKNRVSVLEESVTQGFKGGKYLDRWIVDKKDNKLWQCEIKNWSATAIGGRELKSNADNEETKRVVRYYWERELNNNLSNRDKHPNVVTKVLLEMMPPQEYINLKIEPLVIYWMPVSKDKNGVEPLSIISTKHLKIKTNFPKLYIFSVSLYLRKLYKLYRKGKGKKFIDLDMPNFERRIKILKKF